MKTTIICVILALTACNLSGGWNSSNGTGLLTEPTGVSCLHAVFERLREEQDCTYVRLLDSQYQVVNGYNFKFVIQCDDEQFEGKVYSGPFGKNVNALPEVEYFKKKETKTSLIQQLVSLFGN